jgi:hypothetical protein
MKKAWRVAVAVAGVLAMAAGAVAQEPGRTEEQVRERVEQQVGNAGEADQLRTQQETEQAIEQRAKQPEGAGEQGQKAQERKRIYGEELMTGQERNRYEERLQSMKTEQEREQFQKEHKKEMQERARQQGKVLDKDGHVLTADQLRDRDRDRSQDMDRDRDRIHQMDQTSRPATAPTPRQGGGRGSG